MVRRTSPAGTWRGEAAWAGTGGGRELGLLAAIDSGDGGLTANAVVGMVTDGGLPDSGAEVAGFEVGVLLAVTANVGLLLTWGATARPVPSGVVPAGVRLGLGVGRGLGVLAAIESGEGGLTVRVGVGVMGDGGGAGDKELPDAGATVPRIGADGCIAGLLAGIVRLSVSGGALLVVGLGLGVGCGGELVLAGVGNGVEIGLGIEAVGGLAAGFGMAVVLAGVGEKEEDGLSVGADGGLAIGIGVAGCPPTSTTPGEVFAAGGLIVAETVGTGLNGALGVGEGLGGGVGTEVGLGVEVGLDEGVVPIDPAGAASAGGLLPG